jgi:tetratricopeptide (TPR) repeat protein
MQKYEDAVPLFESLIDQNPEDATAWLLQANAYVGLERPRDAAVNLETVRMLGKAQPSTLALLGDIYMNEGMPELAAEAYLQVIQDDEEAAKFENAHRAADLLIRAGAYGESQKILDRIRERYAGKLSSDEELQVLTLEAKVARALGRAEEAAKVLESIVQRDGTRGDALLELAQHYRDQGETEKAVFLIERAENLSEWKYRALLDHAQVMVGERDYDKAANLLRAALQIKSEPRVERFLARVEEATRL